MVMIRSGLCWDKNCDGGLGFWGANGHDGIWHLSLINNFANGNLGNPVLSGFPLQNYHIGFDLLLSFIVRLTSIPSNILYFQIIPPILSILVGIFVYKFVFIWRKSETESLFALFFVYFGGSMGWLISLIRKKVLEGESMFWSMQSISTLINPPFALSLVLVLSGLIFIFKYQEEKKLINMLLAILFLGLLAGVKVYASLLILTALFTAGIYSFVIYRQLSIIKIFIGVLIISVLLHFPLNGFSSGVVIWKPFWFLESMMALSDRVGWQKFYSAMTAYKMGGIWGKAILAYTAAFLIFIIGNFWTRIISISHFVKKSKNILRLEWIEIILFTIVLAGIVVPTFFVQKGTAWNTIQFLYYSLFFSGILSGVIIGKFCQKSNLNTTILYSIVVVIILLTIPTTIFSVGSYTIRIPQSALPKNELEALNFLKNEPSGIVLTYPYVKKDTAENPVPLYLYTTTAYVSAFSGKPVFLEDEMNLGIMQYSFEERRESIEYFLNTLDEEKAYRFLRENNIVYVYWLKDQHARIGDKQLGMIKIFQNDNVSIFKVN